jgi:response regulator of citrate/malate metabolism
MRLKVLIVEDNLDWEQIWRLVFDVLSEDSQIIWATNAVEARQHLAKVDREDDPFDIIVSDIFLSGSQTGFDLFISLNAYYKARFLFVSAVKSCKVRASLKSHLYQLRVLQKPFRMKEAVTEIRAILKAAHQLSVESEENDASSLGIGE